MKILITGSSGNLGTALAVSCKRRDFDVIGLDISPSENTNFIGSITDKSFIERHMKDIDVVFHTASLHKPHIATHACNDFIHTNVVGTSVLLQAATKFGVKKFIMASTTSIYGDNLIPPIGAPASWINELTEVKSKNIYGATKLAAEELCRVAAKKNIDCIVLRLSRFFFEEDDDSTIRAKYSADNAKVNELLYRRIDIEDAVDAHIAAINYTSSSHFDRFIISATSPFTFDDCTEIRHSPETVLRRLYPEYVALYQSLGWKMFPTIDRVYCNEKARRLLPGWYPRYSFHVALQRIAEGGSCRSPLALEIGWRRYHPQSFAGMPYPV